MSEINQQAIADRLGLSRATVSRCFTNHAGISPVTRAKVFQVAAEIGYTHMESRAPSAKQAKAQVRNLSPPVAHRYQRIEQLSLERFRKAG